jgi:ribosomal protein S18 acetylase RimI-like enzyme
VAAGVFDEHVHPERLAVYLREPGHFFIAAINGAIIVGQCAAAIHRHHDKAAELYIDEVGDANSFLRQGIGAKMLEAMLALGREKGCEEAWLGMEPDNLPARALYSNRAGPPGPFDMDVFDLDQERPTR